MRSPCNPPDGLSYPEGIQVQQQIIFVCTPQASPGGSDDVGQDR